MRRQTYLVPQLWGLWRNWCLGREVKVQSSSGGFLNLQLMGGVRIKEMRRSDPELFYPIRRTLFPVEFLWAKKKVRSSERRSVEGSLHAAELLSVR